MSRRRAIRGVLGNSIETLTSRNADYDGYWIHGLVLAEITLRRLPRSQAREPQHAEAPHAALLIAAVVDMS